MSSTFHFPASGKWYWEYTITGGTANQAFPGIATQPYSSSSRLFYYSSSGDIFENTVGGVSYGDSYTTGDVIGVAANVDDGEVTFYKNDSSQGVKSYTYFDSMTPHFRDGGDTVTMVVNFGQDSSFAGNETAQGNQDDNDVGDFYYDVPAGYLALCTDNLSDPEIALPEDYFNTVLYDGGDITGSVAVTGVGFQPDFVWLKTRVAAYYPQVFNSVLGAAGGAMYPALTNAEDGTYPIASFDSDGFSTGPQAGNTGQNADSMVSWNWKAGTTFDPKTDGDIAVASGSKNATAGFSIVKYTGESGTPTVGHGLGVAPDMIIIKNLDDTKDWNVVAPDIIGTTNRLVLNTNAAPAVGSGLVSPYINSTIFNLDDGTTRTNDGSSEYIAYCFASIEGYSKVGTFTTNASVSPTNNLGSFQYCGFKPALFMLKGIDNTSGWMMWYNAANTYNLVDDFLVANTNAAEVDGGASGWGFLSNGFKQWEGFNGTWIYYAVAENPFKYSNAR